MFITKKSMEGFQGTNMELSHSTDSTRPHNIRVLNLYVIQMLSENMQINLQLFGQTFSHLPSVISFGIPCIWGQKLPFYILIYLFDNSLVNF